MNDWLQSQADELSGTPEYELERLMLTIHRQLTERMGVTGTTRSALARAMGIGRWGISRLLNSVANVELRTLVKAASALNARVTVSIEPLVAIRAETSFEFCGGPLPAGKYAHRTTAVTLASTAVGATPEHEGVFSAAA